MKTFDGYSKEKFSDTSVLLAGGGSKELSNFIGTLNWDSTNRKLQYKKIGDTNWSDLATFGSNALNSISYLPLTGGAINGNLIVNGNTTFKGSTSLSAIVTDGDSNIVFDTLNNQVYAGDTSLLLASFRNGGNIYGLLTAIPNEVAGLYYNSYRLLTNLDFTNPIFTNTTTNTLTISDTSAIGHIVFSRNSYNYITAPTGGVIAFCVNGNTTSGSSCEMAIVDGKIIPGTTNVTSLGDTSRYWTGVYSQGFYKNGSSDDYVLLGGGGHKLITDFATSGHNHSYITIPLCLTLDENSNNFRVEYNMGSNSVTTKPSGVDAFGVMKLRIANGWYGLILMSDNKIYYRTSTNLTSSVSWIKLLDSDNYSSFALPLSGGTCTGDIYAPHFYESSDIRYKKILRNLSITSNIIANLPLFDFEWIENNTIGTGTSAQAVQEILPNIVSGTDKLTLDYGVLGTIAGITACKELVTLKSEIEKLKEKISILELKLSKYESSI